MKSQSAVAQTTSRGRTRPARFVMEDATSLDA